MRRDFYFYVAALLMDICAGIVFLGVPLLAHRLGASVVQLGYIGTIGGISYAVVCPFAGRLGDRIGRKYTILVGNGLFGAAYLLMGQVHRLGLLFVLVPFGGAGAALFWPSIQAWVSEGKDRETLMHSLRGFNVAWSIGLIVGPVIGGLLYEVDPYMPFYAGVGLVSMLAVLTLFASPREGQRPDPYAVMEVRPEQVSRDRVFLHMAWVANFVAWFIAGMVRNIFPKLAVELGIPPGVLGRLIGLVAMAQMVGFLWIHRSDRWPYRIVPLMAFQCLAVVGSMMVYLFSSTYLFGIAFALIGLSMAMTYSSSLFYSVYAEQRKGAKTGLHEGILGSGGVFGALLGGLVAGAFGLKAPYALCLGVSLIGMSVQGMLYVRGVYRRRGVTG